MFVPLRGKETRVNQECHTLGFNLARNICIFAYDTFLLAKAIETKVQQGDHTTNPSVYFKVHPRNRHDFKFLLSPKAYNYRLQIYIKPSIYHRLQLKGEGASRAIYSLPRHFNKR